METSLGYQQGNNHREQGNPFDKGRGNDHGSLNFGGCFGLTSNGFGG
jgi:hypothetical protein